jgi:hypothetical protein
MDLKSKCCQTLDIVLEAIFHFLLPLLQVASAGVAEIG